MSTYNSPTDVAAATLARAVAVNNVDAATATAFGLLPSETLLKNGTVNYAVDSGIVNAYVVTLAQAPASYADGLWVRMRPLNTSTGASTINVNGLGVKTIKLINGTDTVAGSIAVGVPFDMVYSSATGYFHMLGGLGQQGLPGTEVLPFTDTNPHLKGGTDATKLVRFEVDGLTTATTRVITIQDADGTMALAADVPPDTRGIVKGGTDATKVLRFEVDGFTTATTRAATWPDKDGTVAMISDFPTTAVASQAQMETATSNTTAVTPLNTNWHPGVAKAWIKCDAAGAIAASHNITSITDDGTGRVTVTIATDFSSANYVPLLSVIVDYNSNGYESGITATGLAAGALQGWCLRHFDGAYIDPTAWSFVCFGDQA